MNTEKLKLQVQQRAMDAPNKVPHVLVFPFPGQSHINAMLKLAQLLCLGGLRVTFLNTQHNHDRILRFNDVHSSLSRWPGLSFRAISDGLPAEHPRSLDRFLDIFDSLKANTKQLFREMLISGRSESEPVTCLIADGVMTFTIDVAQEVGIPIIVCRTASACSFWSNLCIPRLIEEGEVPFQGDADMDGAIRLVPGMETFLRRRDLSNFLRAKEHTDRAIQLIMTEALNTCRASSLILNTFEDLEGPILSHIRSRISTIYTIGPIHALLKSKLANSLPSTSTTCTSSSSDLWKVDKTCMTWLDSQTIRKSVLFVSFGSYATVTRDEMFEFWHGLVNSGSPFLWVVRPDSVAGKGEGGHISAELEEATRERGFLVEWAPQEEILAHPAVGGFLTHSGWNSTLESIYAGVPMICWPFFGDQQINSRFVSEVWGVGLDMKDRSCDRETVEKMVRELMEGKREELHKSSDEMTEFARRCIREGGSSYCNLERLIEDIRSTSS
ncbi:7-deoxyloganetic acid glucosyltransferase-like [Tasmannia lanceolata]|uniref:7-deoxyloganetic acid glucosyltransferase-like n=1 Tax=Tasmannia lanceolata TaxID=3420 RepID=UPI004063B215